MKKIDQYNNFKESVFNKINQAIDSVHISITNKNYVFSFLKKHECDIRTANIDFDKLEFFNSNDINSSFYINRDAVISKDEILNNILHNNINNFIYLSTVKMDNLLDYISFMTYMYNIPYLVYSILINNFNKKVIETLIEGDKYSFGFGLSGISVKRGKRSENRKAVKWDESNRRKKELQQTTGGKGKWIVYHESPYYNFYYWNKSNCRISNHIFYNFKATSFINSGNRRINDYYKNVSDFKDIIEDDSIGNLEKLNACVKLNPELTNHYLNN